MCAMDNRPVGVALELIRIYGYSLLEDPDRLSQLLEDRCGDSRREIFLISFALRELLKNGTLPDSNAFIAGGEQIEARLRDNLGFSKASAQWVTEAIYELITAGAEVGDDAADSRIEAHRGFLQNIGYVMAKRPRTVLVRKKALRNGLLLLAIIALFLGLFVRITGSRYMVSEDHGVLFLAHLSGPDAALGHVRLKAAQLAADQINAVGGVRGRPIRIRAHDVPQSPGDAAHIVGELMRDRSNAVAVSVCGDEVNAAISVVSDAREMPLIVTESPGMAVTMTAPDRPKLYPFRMNYDNLYKGYIAAYFLTQGIRRTAPALVIEAYNADSYEMREGFAAALGTYGGVTACELSSTRIGGVDRASVEQILMSGADSVVLLNGTTDVAPAIESLRRFGYDGVVVGMAFDDALDAGAGESLENTWWIVPAHHEDPQLQSFQAAYRNKYNESISTDDFVGKLFAYDAIYWVRDALARAPGFQGEAMRHAFMSTRNLALSHATLSMDPRTHGPWNKASALLYWTNGSAKYQRRFRPPA